MSCMTLLSSFGKLNIESHFLLNVVNVKTNAILLHAWTGSEGSRSLRLPDFKTIGI